MKKLTLLSLFCLLFCLQQATGQVIKPWPIPSFNVAVSGIAVFQENCSSDQTKSILEKRKIHVQVSCQKSADTVSCPIRVWIYSLDGLDTLGPYCVSCGQTLEVEIDDREWGALVVADMAINVSVWIE